MIKSFCVLAALALPAALAPPAAAQNVPQCTLMLRVQLEPEVPNPHSPAFLSDLAGDPGFVLVLVKPDHYSEVLQLTGPGPASQCRHEVERIRKDARVIDLAVLNASTG
jgi:hypothetical protein